MQKKHEEHQKRVQTIKSRIDNKHGDTPYGRDRKKERVNHYSSVEQENRLLIDRIGRAMTSKNIDNDKPRERIPISLGEISRRKQLDKITQENRKMLTRIQQVEPIYNRAKWEIEEEKREKLLMTISEFPTIPRARPLTRAVRTRPTTTAVAERLTSSEALSHDIGLPSISSRHSVKTAPVMIAQSQKESPRNQPFDIAGPFSGEDMWAD